MVQSLGAEVVAKVGPQSGLGDPAHRPGPSLAGQDQARRPLRFPDPSQSGMGVLLATTMQLAQHLDVALEASEAFLQLGAQVLEGPQHKTDRLLQIRVPGETYYAVVVVVVVVFLEGIRQDLGGLACGGSVGLRRLGFVQHALGLRDGPGGGGQKAHNGEL